MGRPPEGATVSVLLRVTACLLSSSHGSGAWNRFLQLLAGSDPFFAGATLSLCHLDLAGGLREMLASYGPQAHELTRQGLSLMDIKDPATRLLSRLREGKPQVIRDGRPLPQAVADLLEWLLPSPLAKPLILLPLLRQGRVSGAFWVEGYEPRWYDRERIRMLRLLGNCLSMALTATVHHGEEEERDSILSAALESQERDRERIALDLHDGALQMLASAFQHVQAAMDSRRQDKEVAKSILGKAGGLLREAMNELRGLMNSLQPATLDRFGLIPAIESDVQELRQGGWQAELLADAIKLSKDREMYLYRIFHEALTNVRKHAGSCQVVVSLKREGSGLWGEVRDWGRGFDPAALEKPGRPPGFGLLSMRKRVELLGGRWEVESRAGTGTRIGLHIPLRRKGDLAP